MTASAVARGGESPSGSDNAAVRFAARLRLGVAIAVCAAGSYGSHADRTAALFMLFGLLWVPWAIVVLFASDEPGNRWAVVGGPVGDAVALFALQALVPAARDAVLLGYLVDVVFAGYTAGLAVAGPLAALSLPLVLGADWFRAGSEHMPGGVVLAFSAALAAVVLLLDRTVALQVRASARSDRLEGKAGAILARVADAVVVTDARGRILQCNPAAERLAGRAAERAVGATCAEVLGLRLGERLLDCSAGCGLLALDDPSGGALGHETWRVDGSGRRQPLLANAEAVLDERGRAAEVVHSLRDITRLKQAEEAKTLFLATASHELKTPLTVIKGFADTLLAFPDFDPERRVDALQAIQLRSGELVRIVDRILLSSRIDAGRVQVTTSRVAVVALLRERVAALQSATGRPVDLAADGDLPPVTADGQALITVVDHLLDNALKYSPGGEAVSVRARRVDDDVVRIEVEDSGVGMDAEQAARCFEKFWQAESTDVRRYGGTGIGLYIVRSLVEAMGGRIGVSSTPGVGSVFEVSLPVHRVEDVEPGPADWRDQGERSSIREFMRQIGVPERSAG